MLKHYNTEKKNIGEALNYTKGFASVLHAYSQIIFIDKIMDTNLITNSDKAIIRTWADEATYKRLHGNGDKCWNYFLGMRSSALCYVCSAKNFKYFYKDKAIITDQECRKMVDHCQEHFHHFFNMIKAALVALKAFHHMKSTKMRENVDGKVNSLAELEQKIQTLLTEEKIKIQAIAKVLKYAEGVLKKDSSPEKVCGYFFRVKARPTILLVSDMA